MLGIIGKILKEDFGEVRHPIQPPKVYNYSLHLHPQIFNLPTLIMKT
jgi:hypothetical protein